MRIEALTVVDDNKNKILDNINLDVQEGSIVAIVGESGSGKTTLANVILGTLPSMLKIESGTIVYKNHYLEDLDNKVYEKLYGSELTAIFQNPSSCLNPIIKIGKQFVETISSNIYVDKTNAISIAKKMLKKTNLHNTEKILDSYPFELSRGMLQRVNIAIMFALNPTLVIADEPTSSLDVLSQKQVLDEMLHLSSESKNTMIIITHSLSVASYIADSIVVLCKGNIVEYGAKNQVLNSPQHGYTQELLSSAMYL
ncbi:MAG: ABC transporter ATP-binding protein [Sulfurovum sp.]|nr:ABC transporter ATP-binding protein [Sulfurovum sp.]